MRQKLSGSIVATFLASTVLLLFFQNCSQPGNIVTNELASGSVLAEPGAPQIASQDVASSEPPPLKLFFVMDNSNSMTLSNLNLQRSFEAMFAENRESLSGFNSDTYFISTAQSSLDSWNFLPKLRSPAEFNFSGINGLSAHRASNFSSGAIAGDLLGFRVERPNTAGSNIANWVPQPVVAFRDRAGGTGVDIYPSVGFRRGGSVDDLKALIAERLDLLSPQRASGATDPNLFSALDRESAMCAVGRVLQNPQGLLAPGDMASFVIVSDEDESNLAGDHCIAQDRQDFLYNMNCSEQIPASSRQMARVEYMTASGSPFVRNVFQVQSPDLRTPNRDTLLSLNRSFAAARCSGTYQTNFRATYDVLSPNYAINYRRWVRVGEREGGVVIYSSTVETLSRNVGGALPSDCSTNLAKLRAEIGDTTSRLEIVNCEVRAESRTGSNRQFSFASYPSVNASASSCPANILSELGQVHSGSRVENCRLEVVAVAIPASSITGSGFGTRGSLGECQNAISSVCSSSGGNLRGCAFSNHSAAVEAFSRGPVTFSAAGDYYLNCNADCSQFPGLCDATFSGKVSDFAKSIGATCNQTNQLSATSTFLLVQNQRSVTVDAAAALSCSSTCSQATSACPSGSAGTLTLSAANKSCSLTSSTSMPGSASSLRTLATVIDTTSSGLNCDSACNSVTGLCGTGVSGTTTVRQAIANIGGSQCAVQRYTENIPASVRNQLLTNLLLEEAVPARCPAGMTAAAPARNGGSRNVRTLVRGSSSNLPDYIVSRMNSLLGNQAASLSAFVTPIGTNTAGTATSAGAQYDALVKRIGRGSVNDIRSTSFEPALRNLSDLLRAQLQRSITFSQVQPGQSIRKVWKKKRGASDWGIPLDVGLWSASGGTVTIAASVSLDLDDQIQIEYQ